jgi:hypothetical protein
VLQSNVAQQTDFAIRGGDDFNRPRSIHVPPGLARWEYRARPCGEGR